MLADGETVRRARSASAALPRRSHWFEAPAHQRRRLRHGARRAGRQRAHARRRAPRRRPSRAGDQRRHGRPADRPRHPSGLGAPPASRTSTSAPSSARTPPHSSIELDDLKRNNELHGHSGRRRAAAPRRRPILREVLGERPLRRTHHGRPPRRADGRRARPRDLRGRAAPAPGASARRTSPSRSASAAATPSSGLDGAIIEAEGDARADASDPPARPRADATEAAVGAGGHRARCDQGVLPADRRAAHRRSGGHRGLARWQSRDGVREPDQFLRSVQQAGLIGALFDRILDDGLEHLVRVPPHRAEPAAGRELRVRQQAGQQRS